MAKAEGYINEYEAALKDYNRLVDDYNATLDAYAQSFYNEGELVSFGKGGASAGRQFRDTDFVAFQVDNEWVARRATSTDQGEVLNKELIGRGSYRSSVKDPVTGKTYNINTYGGSAGDGIQDGDTIVRGDGTILRFTPKPGDFTQTAPSFDMDRYKNLLTEDFQTEQKAIQDAFAKTQAEEKAKFDAQRTEMERQAAIVAAENAKAEEQARASFSQAQADAAAAQAERETKTRQFKEETDTIQRDIGARRAGYVRARRMRSRSLLSGA